MCVGEREQLTDIGAVDGQVISLCHQMRAQAGHHPLNIPDHFHGATHHLKHTEYWHVRSDSTNPLCPAECSRQN